MQEIYVITMTEWQIILYSMVMVFYGVGLMKLAPFFEKELNKFVQNLEKKQQGGELMERYSIYGMSVEDNRYYISFIDNETEVVETYEIRINGEGEKMFVAKVGEKIKNQTDEK